MSNPNRVAFVDFEASSLGSGSFPTEIGWAVPDRDPDLAQSGSCLIRPLAKWIRVQTAWSAAAEALTGISQTLLDQEGVPPADAMRCFLAAVNGRLLYSDEPSFDNHWFHMLAVAGGVDISDRELGDAKKLIGGLAIGEGGLKSVLREAEEFAIQRVPKRHRAAADALRLALMYSLLLRKKC